ncbi:unnamed protein product [Kuraishia capsulata CBS 1993]|uniref:Uncharacterized protein n=1 Tax=Kuraishia capsulata CBS 1993 TaxID=1382522 RepID=W6MGR7_9ASCO|nr:uncharacterized protein KUCA_T00000749001 [Kuraishia capsulata CBS 1993]CDK24783.1 unnamed protein product [Kuraishia capsulata CBS 1993]
MPMKKIISSLKKKSSADSDSQSECSSLKSGSSSSRRSAIGSHVSQPHLQHQNHQLDHASFPVSQPNFRDDQSMAASTMGNSFQLSYNSNSVFSKGRTIGTTSTGVSSMQSGGGKRSEFQQFTSIGRPLRVLDEDDSEESDGREQTRQESKVKDPEALGQESATGAIPINNRRQSKEAQDEAASSPVSLQFGFPSYSRANAFGEPTINHGGSLASSPINRVISHASAHSSLNEGPSPELLQMLEYVEKQLRHLSLSISNTLLQVSQSVMNLTKAAVAVSESIKSTIAVLSAKTQMNKVMAKLLLPGQLTTVNSPNLRRLIKNMLFLVDHLLVGNVYQRSKVLILSSLHDLLLKLKLADPASDVTDYSNILQPTLFPLGATTAPFPNEGQTALIMDSLVTKFTSTGEDGSSGLLSDQEGSFIAPVLRGFQNVNLSVITFVFGFPELTREHLDVVKVFSNSVENFHFVCQKNMIKLAATAAPAPTGPTIPVGRTRLDEVNVSAQNSAMYTFKAPFRNALNPQAPPISMSLASENALTLSGTLGGYLYPKIPKDTKNQKLLKYANNVFGVTCAHVALNSDTTYKGPSDYPNISVPSPVLVNLYKRALVGERSKYNSYSEEYKAYNGVVNQIDSIFPLQNVTVQMQQTAEDGSTMLVEKEVKRNVPSSRFGQIVWGERIINESKGMLSDIAIIKVNNRMKCLNFLGDDVNFSEYDPSLMFSNLYVKELVDLSTLGKRATAAGIGGGAGLEVFKYGSTTKYTRGNVNGVKMVYWSDGRLQSSEFVIRSSNYGDSINNSGGPGAASNARGTAGLGFAAGGDSGAWVLAKLSDVESFSEHQQQISQPKPKTGFLGTIFEQFQESLISGALNVGGSGVEQGPSGIDRPAKKTPKTGLGVVGMLHSYDGEFKQFGLFTPMTSILERLQEVTNIEWGIVGVDNCEEDLDVRSENESGYDTEEVSSLNDDTFANDGAQPPTI